MQISVCAACADTWFRESVALNDQLHHGRPGNRLPAFSGNPGVREFNDRAPPNSANKRQLWSNLRHVAFHLSCQTRFL